MPRSIINKARFRVQLASSAWTELVELLRGPAGEPGYGGPNIADLEELGARLAGVRKQLEDWALGEMLRRHPVPGVSLADALAEFAAERAQKNGAL